jgi:hypothetical protein
MFTCGKAPGSLALFAAIRRAPGPDEVGCGQLSFGLQDPIYLLQNGAQAI